MRVRVGPDETVYVADAPYIDPLGWSKLIPGDVTELEWSRSGEVHAFRVVTIDPIVVTLNDYGQPPARVTHHRHCVVCMSCTKLAAQPIVVAMRTSNVGSAMRAHVRHAEGGLGRVISEASLERWAMGLAL